MDESLWRWVVGGLCAAVFGLCGYVLRSLSGRIDDLETETETITVKIARFDGEHEIIKRRLNL